MSRKILKKYLLQVSAMVAALFLTLGFAGQARAGMVYDLVITFTGSGTYLYHDIDSVRDDFFADVTITFNWNSKYHLFLSEDSARACGTENDCFTGWVSAPEIQVNGGVNVHGKDYNGFHSCSDNIASALPGSTFVTTSLTSLTSSAGEGYYFVVEPFSDGEYATEACTSYGGFWNLADHHLLAATDILPLSALAQGKITETVGGATDQIECGDRCTSSVAWVGTLTFEKLAAYGQPGNPAAPVSRFFSYQPSVFPAKDKLIFDAQPIGLGPVADGGETLDFRVGFADYPAPLDLYLAVYFPSLDPVNFWMIGPGPSLQPLTQGLVKWKENVTSAVDETIFSSVPTSMLPAGQYYFYLLATPHGSTDYYYVWDTSFTK